MFEHIKSLLRMRNSSITLRELMDGRMTRLQVEYVSSDNVGGAQSQEKTFRSDQKKSNPSSSLTNRQANQKQ
jgi:hypothetical protein